MAIIYERTLKDANVIMDEVLALSPSVDSAKFSGGSLKFTCSRELTEDEILALATYNPYTLMEWK